MWQTTCKLLCWKLTMLNFYQTLYRSVKTWQTFCETIQTQCIYSWRCNQPCSQDQQCHDQQMKQNTYTLLTITVKVSRTLYTTITSLFHGSQITITFSRIVVINSCKKDYDLRIHILTNYWSVLKTAETDTSTPTTSTKTKTTKLRSPVLRPRPRSWGIRL